MSTTELQALEVLTDAIRELVKCIEERHAEVEVTDGQIKRHREPPAAAAAAREEEKRQVILDLETQLNNREELVKRIKRGRAKLIRQTREFEEKGGDNRTLEITKYQKEVNECNYEEGKYQETLDDLQEMIREDEEQMEMMNNLQMEEQQMEDQEEN